MQRLFLLLFFLPTLLLTAQEDAVRREGSYRVDVSIEGYEEDILTLGYYLLNNQYIVDTARRADGGRFVFESDTTALPAGMYLVVLAPDNNFFEILVTDDEQEFSVATSMEALNRIDVEGSTENALFFAYTRFLDSMQRAAQPLRQTLSDSTTAPALRAQNERRLEEMDRDVKTYQQQLREQRPDAFVTAIVDANGAAVPPDFDDIADEDVRREKQWRWLQEHYLDGLDVSDERLLRTPFLFNRIDYYVHKLQVPHPDSLAAAIDRVLGRMDPNSEVYKYYTVHYTNEAATSNIVGMDALYVHMVDTYYRGGKAYWSDEEQLRKMTETAERLRPLLIGRTAPDLEMVTREGEDVSLHETEADYTILYFWRYDCPACKKSTPVMKEVYEKWGDRGVEIFSVCTKGVDELGACWDYVDEQGIGDWVQAVDPYQRYYKDYDIKSTPAIFVLDKDKRIVSKRIGADQLDELLTNLTQQVGTAAAGK